MQTLACTKDWNTEDHDELGVVIMYVVLLVTMMLAVKFPIVVFHSVTSHCKRCRHHSRRSPVLSRLGGGKEVRESEAEPK